MIFLKWKILVTATALRGRYEIGFGVMMVLVSISCKREVRGKVLGELLIGISKGFLG
ncbi:MAG: hypothetical protein ACI8YQ_005159 [Polaribacter sp.]